MKRDCEICWRKRRNGTELVAPLRHGRREWSGIEDTRSALFVGAFDDRGSEPESDELAVCVVEPASGDGTGQSAVRYRYANPHRGGIPAALGLIAAAIDEAGAGTKPAQGRAVDQRDLSADHGTRKGRGGHDLLG